MVGVLALCLVGFARTSSGLAHLHAILTMNDPTPAATVAACSEAVAALDDFWPALPLLNVGRIAPLASARALGQVPAVAALVRNTCPAISLYAGPAPWPDRSIEDGVMADLLTDVRSRRADLTAASQQISRAWSDSETLDVQAMAADPRLARIARLISTARQQQDDVTDLLTISSPEHIEMLLGGDGPRAIVLSVMDGENASQAYMTLQEGRVVGLDIGTPPAPPVATIWLDQAGLSAVIDKLGGLKTFNGASGPLLARAVLAETVRRPLSYDQNVLSAIHHSADEHHAWLRFEDAALQAVVVRRGWARE